MSEPAAGLAEPIEHRSAGRYRSLPFPATAIVVGTGTRRLPELGGSHAEDIGHTQSKPDAH